MVRPAKAQDLPVLAAALAPLPLFARYNATPAGLARRWAEALAAGEPLLVAEEGGVALGLCWFRRDGTFSTGAYLRTLAVVPAAQGRGVGKALLSAYEAA